MPLRQIAREKVPALAITVGLQLAVAWLFVRSLILPPQQPQSTQHKTQVIFLTLLNPQTPAKHKSLKPGSNAITPYVNPYALDPSVFSTRAETGLATALSACDVDKYDMASDEIRAVCDRIGALIRHDPGRFGFTSEVVDAGHWSTELARREAPVLLPCMSPNGVMLDLFCVYNFLVHPYDPEKRARYSK